MMSKGEVPSRFRLILKTALRMVTILAVNSFARPALTLQMPSKDKSTISPKDIQKQPSPGVSPTTARPQSSLSRMSSRRSYDGPSFHLRLVSLFHSTDHLQLQWTKRMRIRPDDGLFARPLTKKDSNDSLFIPLANNVKAKQSKTSNTEPDRKLYKSKLSNPRLLNKHEVYCVS